MVGAGEARSRAKVKREATAAVGSAVLEKYREDKLEHAKKLIDVVTKLSDAIASKDLLDREAAANARRATAIENLKGQLEFAPVDSPQYHALRSAIINMYQKPLSSFVIDPAIAATATAPAAPATATATSSAVPASNDVSATSVDGGAGAASGVVNGVGFARI